MSKLDILLPNDTFDFGVDDNEQSVNVIETDSGQITLKENEIENPFFVGLNGGTLNQLSWKDMRDTLKIHTRVLIICMKDRFKPSEKLYQIFDRVINRDTLYKLSSEFALIPASLNILKNNKYKTIAVIVERKYLSKMFPDMPDLNIEQTEIVVPMFELTECNTRLNMSLYDKQIGVESLKNIVALTSFYNSNYNTPVISQLSSYLSDLKETQFWSNPDNCHITMNNSFNDRKFKYIDKESRIDIKKTDTDKDVDKVIDFLDSGKFKNVDYLNFSDKDKQTSYVDISDALTKGHKKKIFYDSVNINNLRLTKMDVSEIFTTVEDEQELYHIFNALVVSKEYCHLVLNNIDVLNKMKPLFEKYMPVYKYLLGYAWLCFCIEEGLSKTRSTKDSRYVFNINTANKLPIFPYIFEDLTQNPYIAVLLNKHLIDASKNAIGLPFIDGHNGYGVCTLDEFKHRFNLFTTGDSQKTLFDGIDWNSFAISGSVMSACTQKKSPLMMLTDKPNMTEDEKLLSYFNSYYSESDIDLMCNDKSIFSFTTKLNTIIEQLKKNIYKYTNQESNIEVETVKSLTINVSKQYFDEVGDDIRKMFKTNWTSDEMLENLYTDEMKEYFYVQYVKYKSAFNRKIRERNDDKNPYIKKFMIFSPINEMKLRKIEYETSSEEDNLALDSDQWFYVNDFRTDKKVSNGDNVMIMKICEGVRFKIKSKHMKRTVEVFRIRSNDFFSKVSEFHFPCVRAYYTGDNVYMLPTFITAMMTGINIDYKYFAGIRDPIDIINKYSMRGFGVLLNENERKHMAYYNSTVNTFGGMFYTDKNQDAILKSFGSRDLSDKRYRPLVHMSGLLQDTYNNPQNVNYVKTLSDLKAYYKTKCKYDLELSPFNIYRITPIAEDGSINPYQPYIAQMFYDMMKNKK